MDALGKTKEICKCYTCEKRKECEKAYGRIGVDVEDCRAIEGTHFCWLSWQTMKDDKELFNRLLYSPCSDCFHLKTKNDETRLWCNRRRLKMIETAGKSIGCKKRDNVGGRIINRGW